VQNLILIYANWYLTAYAILSHLRVNYTVMHKICIEKQTHFM